jgi:competence protein ComEC
VIVERDGATAALRGEDGSLVIPPATAASYSVENWLLADGDDCAAEVVAKASSFRCDALGCIGKVKGKTVALVRHPGALEEDCRLADIVIASFTVKKPCRAARVIVDRRKLLSEGAHALYFEGLSIRTLSVSEARGDRPWVPDRQPATRAPPSTSGRAYAGDGEDASDPRFDGNPEE